MSCCLAEQDNMCKTKKWLKYEIFLINSKSKQMPKIFVLKVLFILKGDELFDFYFCLYSFIDFTGEIDKWDEKKSNGVENWEPH